VRRRTSFGRADSVQAVGSRRAEDPSVQNTRRVQHTRQSERLTSEHDLCILRVAKVGRVHRDSWPRQQWQWRVASNSTASRAEDDSLSAMLQQQLGCAQTQATKAARNYLHPRARRFRSTQHAPSVKRAKACNVSDIGDSDDLRLAQAVGCQIAQLCFNSVARHILADNKQSRVLKTGDPYKTPKTAQRNAGTRLQRARSVCSARPAGQHEECRRKRSYHERMQQ
jgi:hypothetical protein